MSLIIADLKPVPVMFFYCLLSVYNIMISFIFINQEIVVRKKRNDLTLKWGKLQLFYHVAQMGSFARTAEFFNVSSVVIIKRIQNLEEELDLKLFIRARGSGGIDLTTKGLKIFQLLCKIDRDFSKIDNYLLELKDKEE